MTDPKQIIINILDIIEFEEDKEEYADKFIQVCEDQAILELIKSLSDDKQDELVRRVSESGNNQQNTDILREYFNEKDYGEALKTASEKVFRNYLEAIDPSLTNEQREKLEKYLKSIS